MTTDNDPDHTPAQTSGPGPHPAEVARPPLGDHGVGARTESDQLPLLATDLQRRAAFELVDSHGMDLAPAQRLVAGFDSTNHYEAWARLMNREIGPGLHHEVAAKFLERFGFWPPETPGYDTCPNLMSCVRCGLEIRMGDPCTFSVTRRVRFWVHARCAK